MGEFTKAREMPIGAASRRTGVNVETIRYYEKIDLMPKPRRTAGGNRVYDLEHVRRLTFIRRSRDLGFSLGEIKEMLDLSNGGSMACGEVHAIAVRQLEAIKSRIEDLRRLEAVLGDMASECELGIAPECPIVRALSEA